MKTIIERKKLIFASCHTVIANHEINDALIAEILSYLAIDKNEQSLLFPGGINEFLLEFSGYLDANLVLSEVIKGTTAKIHQLLWQRITEPQISQEALKKVLRYMSKPSNLPLATKIAANSADHIWNLAGDASTDMNYYSKRGLLMSVYIRALRFYAHDTSEGYKATDQKIAELLANVLKIASVKNILTAPKRFISMVKERL